MSGAQVDTGIIALLQELLGFRHANLVAKSDLQAQKANNNSTLCVAHNHR